MLNSLETVSDVFACSLIFLIGLIFIIPLGRRIGVSPELSILLYAWHSVFCYAYYVFILAEGGDAAFYYEQSVLDDVEGKVLIGTWGIVAVCRIFSHYLGLSFFAVNLIFNIVGALGLLYFYSALKYAAAPKTLFMQKMPLLIALLPSCSFWSSAIGKDSLSFFSVSLAVWASRDLSRYRLIFVIAVATMFFVRGHIAMLMIASYMLAVFINVRRLNFGSIALILVAMCLLLFVGPFFLSYVGLELLSIQSLTEYIEGRQRENQTGGGAVDISTLSLPMQLLTYLFRPTIFETGSLIQLLAALENLFLALAVLITLLFYRKKQNVFSGNSWYLITFSMLGLLLLATTTANLGLAFRQKWMILPTIYILLMIYSRNAFVRNQMRVPAWGAYPQRHQS